MKKEEKPIVGHIEVIGQRRITSRKRRRVLSIEEREKLIAQAKSAYEIRINSAEEPIKGKRHKGELLFPTP